MRRKIMATFVVIFLFPAFYSCTVMRSTYQERLEESQALARKNAELAMELELLKANLEQITRLRDKAETDLEYVSGQLDRAMEERDETERTIFALERENERLKQLARTKEEQVEQVRKTSTTYEELLLKMQTEIEQGQVAIRELEGRLTVNLVDSILFDVGKAEISPGGKEILSKVVSILKEVKGKSIRIEGHTDNLRIAGALARQFPSNWELSAARAINVTRFLQDKGISGSRLSAVAYGKWRPIADNSTPKGRAQNRRIEIILVDGDEN